MAISDNKKQNQHEKELANIQYISTSSKQIVQITSNTYTSGQLTDQDKQIVY
jgi:hypothetical protein